MGARRTVDSSHDEFNLSRIGCTSEMGINLFLLGLVKRDEAVEDIVTSSLIISTTWVIVSITSKHG